jgi:hypothetical protein
MIPRKASVVTQKPAGTRIPSIRDSPPRRAPCRQRPRPASRQPVKTHHVLLAHRDTSAAAALGCPALAGRITGVSRSVEPLVRHVLISRCLPPDQSGGAHTRACAPSARNCPATPTCAPLQARSRAHSSARSTRPGCGMSGCSRRSPLDSCSWTPRGGSGSGPLARRGTATLVMANRTSRPAKAPRSRPLSRDRTRCPRCPASRGTTRCSHRQ